jgi:hypothetical protein
MQWRVATSSGIASGALVGLLAGAVGLGEARARCVISHEFELEPERTG